MLFKVSDSKRAVMYDVLHVPKLSCNLFSVRAAAKRGNTVKFGQSRCWIRGPKGTLNALHPIVHAQLRARVRKNLLEKWCDCKRVKEHLISRDGIDFQYYKGVLIKSE